MMTDWVCCGSNSYLPAIGRFLIVVTFLEDALRIITQWGDQLTYLRDYRHSLSLLSSLSGLTSWFALPFFQTNNI